MLRLFSRLTRRNASKNSVGTQPAPVAPRATVEQLEGRQLFAAAPYITSISADNRGEVILNTDRSLNPATVNTRSVFLFSVGPDGEALTADDVKMPIRPIYTESNRQLRIRTIGLEANTTYFVKLSAKQIYAYDGTRLDGEFRGAGVRTGNGAAYGDLLFVSRRDKTNRPTARFSTAYGAMNVTLFRDLTPQTVNNFLAYSNSAAWDGTFIHRNLKGFVSQGGGYTLTQDNGVDRIDDLAPVANEFIPGTTTNIRGRIAMAKLPGNPNSATNEWFFNAADNRGDAGNPADPNDGGLDFQNGGFTAFGEINAQAGLDVLDRIQNLASLDNVNLPGLGTFQDVPLNDAQAYANRGNVVNPLADLVEVRRVAILNKIGPMA